MSWDCNSSKAPLSASYLNALYLSQQRYLQTRLTKYLFMLYLNYLVHDGTCPAERLAGNEIAHPSSRIVTARSWRAQDSVGIW